MQQLRLLPSKACFFAFQFCCPVLNSTLGALEISQLGGKRRFFLLTSQYKLIGFIPPGGIFFVQLFLELHKLLANLRKLVNPSNELRRAFCLEALTHST
ncbi:hypothetical protein D3C85_1295000 [compost metagenome]